MTKSHSSMVLILGADSWRAERALKSVLQGLGAEPDEITRIWGDEASFPEVIAAATSRSLFSTRTIVLVRRAERLRGAGGGDAQSDPADEEAGSGAGAEGEAPEERDGPAAKRGARGPAASELPDLDPASCLIFLARKVDRRIGMWKRLSKVAEVVDADYLKGKSLYQAAAAEARALGLRASEEIVRETVDQSGPALGRIVSEFEKMLLFQGASGGATEESLAVTSSRPLYLLSDAISSKDKGQGLALLDEAARQGEAGLRILGAAQGGLRRLAVFRALRRTGVSAADAGAQAGLQPFKIMDTERAVRLWSDADLGRALSVFAEADRRLKLSAPALPVLSHAIAVVCDGGRS